MKSLSSLAFSMSIFIASQAQAAFTCGPGFNTYAVVSTGGAAGAGVRCVKFNGYEVHDGAIAGAFWYGEGNWGAMTYRHIGYSYKTLKDFNGNYTARAQAADIYGNGENAAGSTENIRLLPVDGWKRIRVTGDWNEEWVFQGSGTHAGYNSTLGNVTKCGDHLDTLKVSDAAGSVAGGTGVRCALRNSYLAYPSVWYGEGNWGANRYQHLGFWSGSTPSDTSVALATAADICNRASYFCGATALSGLQLKPLMGCFQKVKYRVTGNWNENWSSDTAVLDCVR